MKHNKLVSWWFRPYHGWNPLDEKTKDLYRRRADSLAENGANAAIVFGFHFRWDFMRHIDNMHETIRFCAEELHKRNIFLWDHHSAVLANNYNPDPARNSRTMSNHGQNLATLIDDPVYPDLHDDWKMIDVTTGKPAFLPQYGSQEFCINNPDFRSAYAAYLKRLVAETGIDGLMCDDATFYPRLYACTCPHCRARYGKELPPHTDLTFWGNWENKEFLAWLKMRVDSVRDFNDMVAANLPEDFPLMNCASSSCYASSTETGLWIENFLHSSNHAMLEMCGNTPNVNGRYDGNLAAQLLQIAAAEQKHAPLYGLGYGFCGENADFIWAFNKFLGTSTWFSQVIHRMRLSNELVQAFPDDSEHVGNGFHAEDRFAEWFTGKHKKQAALLYSRNTVLNYGGYEADCCDDYAAACKQLFAKGWDFDVVLSVKEAEEYPVLFLATAAMLTDEDKRALAARKGKVYACGPLDGQEVPVIHREPMWPHDLWTRREPVPCKTPGGWREIRKDFQWHPAKASSGQVEFPLPDSEPVPQGWFRRTFTDEKGRTLIHYLVSAFQVGLDEDLEAKRSEKNKTFFIKTLTPVPGAEEIKVPAGAEVLEPLTGSLVCAETGVFVPPPGCRYFIVRQKN